MNLAHLCHPPQRREINIKTDEYIEGMTYSELVGDIKNADSADLPKVEPPDPFKDWTDEGMTFSELAKDNKSSDSEHLPPEPPDPFKDWTDEEKKLKDEWDNGKNTIIINKEPKRWSLLQSTATDKD